MNKTMVRTAMAVASVAFAVTARADVFHMPSGDTSLQFVTVGNPGNAADPTIQTDGSSGYGSVPYIYQMGTYDVTLGQYCQFLNAVATQSDPYGLYDAGMSTAFSTLGIRRSGGSGSYSYSVTGSYSQAVNCPIFDVNWGDAARFCNWLQNGQPTSGTEGVGTTETGSYALGGATSQSALMAVTRSSTATYAIPTENEWYKAAYYKGGGTNAGYWAYPTQSNTMPSNLLSAAGTNNANYEYDGTYTDPVNYLTPVGYFASSPSAYGTYDMGGDVSQWNEGELYGNSRGARGGQYLNIIMPSSNRNYGAPVVEGSYLGFRVVSVPEPASIALLLAGGTCLLAFACGKRRPAKQD